MTSLKSDLPQGTLDLLILKTVALGPVHGYAIAQRLQQISRDVLKRIGVVQVDLFQNMNAALDPLGDDRRHRSDIKIE